LDSSKFQSILSFVPSRTETVSGATHAHRHLRSQYFSSLRGIVAGTLATAVTHPPDVIKTRLQTQFHFVPKNNSLFPQRQYKGTLHAVVKIYREEGLLTFFRGFLPRMIRRTLMAAFTWTFYEEIKWWWSRVLERN